MTGATTTNGISNNSAGITNAGLISGVTAGAVSANSTQAVNGSQLYSVQNALQGQVNNIQSQVNQNNQIALAGIAGVGAAASLPALDAGKKFNLGMGVANYQGYSAMAVGAQMRVADSVVVKVTGSQSLNGGVQTGMFGAGVGWSF